MGGKDARLELARIDGIKTHPKFEELLEELAHERLTKVKQYGEKRYDVKTFSKLNHLWMCFGDVFRNYIRLEQLTETALKTNELEDLRSTYLEIASYGLMGVQIIDMLNEKGETK